MAWTDDSIRDAEHYFSDQDEQERACLHCVVCGATIWNGDDYFEIDDMELCEDCMMDSYRKVADYDNL